MKNDTNNHGSADRDNSTDPEPLKKGAEDYHRRCQEQALFSSGPVVLFKWENKEGWPVCFVTANVQEVIGYSDEELMAGVPDYASLVDPDDLGRVIDEVASSSKGRASRFTHDPYRIICKDGSRIWVRDHTVILRDSSGEIAYYLGYLIDISDTVGLQQEQLEIQKKLQDTQKLESLGVLAGGIAHDFNNLLTTILGNADMALRKISSTSPARQSIEDIVTAGRRAADLANQMLAYSGKSLFAIESLDLSEVVREMAHLMEVSISKKVVLRYEFENNLEPIKGDATQIRQIIMNLITNASEAVGNESGLITLHTGTIFCDKEYMKGCCLSEELNEGSYSFIEVSDTGCGMDHDIIDRLFDPFYTTKFTGRGLGMSTVLGIVKSHGGAIKVYSEIEKGSSIKVLFPVSRSGGPAQKTREVEEPVGLEFSGTVLLADDEESVRTVTKDMLNTLGFTVLEAGDGQKAVDVFKEQHGKLLCVFLDLTMPQIDGKQAFEGMRRIDRTVPIIIFSGYAEREATERLVGKGLNGFLQKPFLLRQLSETIRSVLQMG